MATILFDAILIGLTLGMLGSGGSAITVPILVYLVGHETKQSIAESMGIVGLISLAAAIPYAAQRQIHWRSVICFGIPGMIGTFGGAWLGGMSPAVLQLIVFGAVLILAAYFMLRKPKVVAQAAQLDVEPEIANTDIWKIALEGTIVGVVTGYVGVGGGFLIVPALVLLAQLPMRLAIGTSLVIIAAKSVVGFFKYQNYLTEHQQSVDWETIAVFTVIGVIGSLVGKAINQRLNQQILKSVFAIFLIILGGFVMVSETVKAVSPPAEERLPETQTDATTSQTQPATPTIENGT